MKKNSYCLSKTVCGIIKYWKLNIKINTSYTIFRESEQLRMIDQEKWSTILEEYEHLDVAPVTEPQRQYYFIKKCQQYVKQESEELGRPLYCKIVTFGCQMNARDSEKLTGILEEIGYEMIDQEEKADFVIYNTCTVRENANQRVYGRLGQLNRVKRKNTHMLIGLCGCMMQEPHVVEKV